MVDTIPLVISFPENELISYHSSKGTFFFLYYYGFKNLNILDRFYPFQLLSF